MDVAGKTLRDNFTILGPEVRVPFLFHVIEALCL